MRTLAEFDVRIRLHTPAGVKGRILKTLSLDATAVQSGAAQLRFTMSSKVRGSIQSQSGLLLNPFIVGLEYAVAGGRWEAPRDNLFIAAEDEGDTIDPSGVVSFTAQGYVPWLAARALLHWSPSVEDGERTWLESGGPASAGYILSGMITEAKTRGWGAQVSIDFSGSSDSNGATWVTGDKVLQNYRLLTPLSQVLDGLARQGLCDWWTEGTTLRVFRPGTTGLDRTRIKLGGRGFTRGPGKGTFHDVFTDLIVVPEKSPNWLYLDNTGADDRFGRLEASMTQSGVEDHTTATRNAQSALLEGRAVKQELSFEWTVTEGMPRPFLDFNVGDQVTVKGRAGWETDARSVVGFVVTKEGSTVTVRAVTGARILTAGAKVATLALASSVGRVIGGSGQSMPGSSGPAAIDPDAPAGLHVNSNVGYFAADGTARARVELEWTAVTQASDGSTVDVVEYEVWHRVSPSLASRVTATDSPISVIDTWESGVARLVKVRARSAGNVWGAFSSEISVTPAAPSTVPSAPTAPSLTSKLATITAAWNGSLTSGAPGPSFSHAIAQAATSSGGPWTQVGGSFVRGGVTFPAADVGADLGDTVWVRFIAVSPLGALSTASTAATVVVTGVEGPDIEADTVTANNLAVGAVEAQHLNVGVGDTGAHIELVGSGLSVFDDNGDEVIYFGTARSNVLNINERTAGGELVSVASIAETGDAKFQRITAQDIEFAGNALVGNMGDIAYNGQLIDTPYLERSPRGVVYSAGLGTDYSEGRLRITAAHELRGLGSGTVALDPGRLYTVAFDSTFIRGWTAGSSSSSLVLEVWIGDGTQDVKTPNDTNGVMLRWPVLEGNHPASQNIATGLNESVPFSISGTKNVLVRLNNPTARGYTFYNLDVEPRIIIQDVGPVIDAIDGGSIATRLTATTGGSAAPVTPVNPQPQTAYYTAAWSQLFDSGGALLGAGGSVYADGRMIQGGLNNNRFGYVGFGALGLSGRTITGMWIALTNRHAGARPYTQIQFGIHGHGSAPGVRQVRSGAWDGLTAPGEHKWHPIPSSLWAGFASGTYRGITLGSGVGGSGASAGNYAIFDGASTVNATGGGRDLPVLIVSYR